MNKTEFLAALEARLRVLDKREINDIIDEYAQHIDMKLASGMAEADAIGDFGSLDELAAEILTAYHINPAYDEKYNEEKYNEKDKAELAEAPPTPQPDAAEPKHKGAGYALDSAGKGLKAAFAACGRGIKSGFALIGRGIRAIWQGVGTVCAFICGLLVKAWQALMGKEQPQMVEMQGEDGSIYIAAQPVKQEGLLPRLFRFCFYLALAFAVLVALAPLTLFLLGFVFCFGTLLVMQLSGYPLLGPLLVFFGLTLMGAALWLLLISLLRRKREAA